MLTPLTGMLLRLAKLIIRVVWAVFVYCPPISRITFSPLLRVSNWVGLRFARARSRLRKARDRRAGSPVTHGVV